MQYDGILGNKPVRENFDFVTMDTHAADMRESSEQAAHIIGELRVRADRAERLIAELVLAAGGKISVSPYFLHDPKRKVELTQWRNVADETIVFTAVSPCG